MTWEITVGSLYKSKTILFDSSRAKSNIVKLYKLILQPSPRGQEKPLDCLKLDPKVVISLHDYVQSNVTDLVLENKIKSIQQNSAEQSRDAVLSSTYSQVVAGGVFYKEWKKETVLIKVSPRPRINHILPKLQELQQQFRWLAGSPVILRNGEELAGKTAITRDDTVVVSNNRIMQIPVLCEWEERVAYVFVPVTATLYSLKQQLGNQFPIMKKKGAVLLKAVDLDRGYRGDYINTLRWDSVPLLKLGITPREVEINSDAQISMSLKDPKDIFYKESSGQGQSEPGEGQGQNPSEGQGNDLSGPGNSASSVFESYFGSLDLAGSAASGGGGTYDCGGKRMKSCTAGDAGQSKSSLQLDSPVKSSRKKLKIGDAGQSKSSLLLPGKSSRKKLKIGDAGQSKSSLLLPGKSSRKKLKIDESHKIGMQHYSIT